MAIKVSVGLQKKIGQPNYGSLGASCHVEFEVDPSMIDSNIELFHNKVNGVYLACRHAIANQLHQQQTLPAPPLEEAQSSEHQKKCKDGKDAKAEANTTESITPSQLRMITELSRRLDRNPDHLAQEHFERSTCEELSFREASEVIDQLKREKRKTHRETVDRIK